MKTTTNDLLQIDRRNHMKHIATVALMLNLGVASIYAQQKPVTMTFSGTAGPSAINLQQPNTTTGEDNLAGNGALGPFTFRNISAETAIPQQSSTCSGPTKLYFVRVDGAGVFYSSPTQLPAKIISPGTVRWDHSPFVI